MDLSDLLVAGEHNHVETPGNFAACTLNAKQLVAFKLYRSIVCRCLAGWAEMIL